MDRFGHRFGTVNHMVCVCVQCVCVRPLYGKGPCGGVCWIEALSKVTNGWSQVLLSFPGTFIAVAFEVLA